MNIDANCKGISPDGNFKHLDQTYMMPMQYEAYKHNAKCKGISPEKNYKDLGQTYMMPTAAELFKHDPRLACIGLQPQGNFMNLNQTYMMPTQYEAFESRQIVGTEANFLNPGVVIAGKAGEDEKTFLSSGQNQKNNEHEMLDKAIVSNLSSQLGLNLQKPNLQNNIKKPVYTSINNIESVDAHNDDSGNPTGFMQSFLDPNILIAKSASNNNITN